MLKQGRGFWVHGTREVLFRVCCCLLFSETESTVAQASLKLLISCLCLPSDETIGKQKQSQLWQVVRKWTPDYSNSSDRSPLWFRHRTHRWSADTVKQQPKRRRLVGKWMPEYFLRHDFKGKKKRCEWIKFWENSRCLSLGHPRNCVCASTRVRARACVRQGAAILKNTHIMHNSREQR